MCGWVTWMQAPIQCIRSGAWDSAFLTSSLGEPASKVLGALAVCWPQGSQWDEPAPCPFTTDLRRALYLVHHISSPPSCKWRLRSQCVIILWRLRRNGFWWMISFNSYNSKGWLPWFWPISQKRRPQPKEVRSHCGKDSKSQSVPETKRLTTASFLEYYIASFFPALLGHQKWLAVDSCLTFQSWWSQVWDSVKMTWLQERVIKTKIEKSSGIQQKGTSNTTLKCLFCFFPRNNVSSCKIIICLLKFLDTVISKTEQLIS